jgi:hypothetical protein
LYLERRVERGFLHSKYFGKICMEFPTNFGKRLPLQPEILRSPETLHVYIDEEYRYVHPGSTWLDREAETIITLHTCTCTYDRTAWVSAYCYGVVRNEGYGDYGMPHLNISF